MKYLLFVLAILATIAMTGMSFYMLVKRYLDNQQKQRLLKMKIEEP